MYETAVVSATEKCSLGAKIPKMSLQAYDSCRQGGMAACGADSLMSVGKGAAPGTHG